MSQQALASTLGVTFQQIQKYERGSNRMAASTLHDAATVLGVPVAYFFEESAEHDRAAAAVAALRLIQDSEGFAINRAFAAIKDRPLVTALVSLIERLAARSSSPVADPRAGRRKRGR